MALPDHFENFCWHDNAIHGFRFVAGDDGCSGDLVLDLDFIVEWMQPGGDDARFKFRVAPANLTFHATTDLLVSIDYGAASAAFGPMVIHEIKREVITYANGFSSFAWTIDINWPPGSQLSFISSGFTQVLRSEPIVRVWGQTRQVDKNRRGLRFVQLPGLTPIAPLGQQAQVARQLGRQVVVLVGQHIA
ncbi:MAG: hypothetical protein V4582_01960, partial [Pseudomonadota bacterium]